MTRLRAAAAAAAVNIDDPSPAAVIGSSIVVPVDHIGPPAVHLDRLRGRDCFVCRSPTCRMGVVNRDDADMSAAALRSPPRERANRVLGRLRSECSESRHSSMTPFAALLSPKGHEGAAVGLVLSGVLVGVLVSKVVAGLVTVGLGWRALYWAAAVTMIGLGLFSERNCPRAGRRGRRDISTCCFVGATCARRTGAPPSRALWPA